MNLVSKLKKAAGPRSVYAIVRTNPQLQEITPNTPFHEPIIPPAPGFEESATIERQLEALNKWCAIAGDHPIAQVTITAGGQETISTENGIIGGSPTDAGLLLAIKSTRQYKKAVSKARTQAKTAAQAVKDFEDRLATLENIGSLAPTPQDLAWYQSNIEEVQGGTLTPSLSQNPSPPWMLLL